MVVNQRVSFRMYKSNSEDSLADLNKIYGGVDVGIGVSVGVAVGVFVGVSVGTGV